MLKPVTRIEPTESHLAIPRHAAPPTGDPVVHLLFALKHEGTNLPILAQALPLIDPAALLAERRASPTGACIRTACYLWEKFSSRELTDLPAIGGPTAEVFDSARYVTGLPARDPRWRVAFNGLGSLRYCATVERTGGDALSRTSSPHGRWTFALGLSGRCWAWASSQPLSSGQTGTCQSF